MTIDDFKAQVRARIRQARTARGWTQKELAERLGLASNVTVARYESGERNVDLDTLARIAAVTGREVSWFLDAEPQTADLQDLVEQLRLAEAALLSIRRTLERIVSSRANHKA